MKFENVKRIKNMVGVICIGFVMNKLYYFDKFSGILLFAAFLAFLIYAFNHFMTENKKNSENIFTEEEEEIAKYVEPILGIFVISLALCFPAIGFYLAYFIK